MNISQQKYEVSTVELQLSEMILEKNFDRTVRQFPKYYIIMYIFHVTNAICMYIFHLNCSFLWLFFILKMHIVSKISTFFEVHPF